MADSKELSFSTSPKAENFFFKILRIEGVEKLSFFESANLIFFFKEN